VEKKKINCKKKLLFFNVAPMPHSLLIYQEFVNSGYLVDFWFIKDEPTIYPWKEKLSRIQPYNTFKTNLKNIIKLVKSTNESDLVVITGWNSVAHVVLAIYCFLRGITYAYWLDIPLPPKRGFKKFVKKKLLELCDGLFVTGEYGFKIFREYYHVSEDKCYNFPYLEDECQEGELFAFNKQRRLDLTNGDKIKILIANRFLKRKGHSTILSAFRALPQNLLERFEIRIIGDGPEKKYYQDQYIKIHGNIVLDGWVEYEKYRQALKSTDVLIHASMHEPYGIPPMDAMKYGKLVVCSTGVYSGLDRIKHGENGFLFSASNVKELEYILRNVADNRELVYKLGDNAYSTSLQYGFKTNLLAVERILNSPSFTRETPVTI